ncbi:serine/threonine-protein kinase [Legionella cherrii]|uniref:Serine/threonine-protein kinase n=1 Tax=Legionella cherrii TaxID=28084 RepID=A0A0W0S5N5_9GAMM|nr:protein kinase [Legionella cherrii]KTC78787.1 serine/threonine-protein kinase [Legionella cherrii]
MRAKSELENNTNPADESVIIINPTQLSQEQIPFLIDFLEGDDNPEVFLKDTVYTHESIRFKLTHELNWRSGKDGISECFEVMRDGQAASGKFGRIDLIEGKLVFNERGLEFIPISLKPHKERVRKFILFKQEKEEAIWRKSINEEYKRTKQAGHLKVRKPVFFRDHDGSLGAYFIIKKAPGITLHDLLYGTPQEPLDTATRKAISLAILDAYIEQVKRRGLVHNDISLRNIMVDLSNPKQPIVTFIDFAFAKKIKVNDSGSLIRGTPVYMAPERFEGDGSSTASDVFALGHILAEIWGEQRMIPNPKLGIKGVYLESKKGLFDSDLIHLEESELSENEKESIMYVLLPTLAPKPELRPSPEEIKEVFTRDYEYLEEPVDVHSKNSLP